MVILACNNNYSLGATVWFIIIIIIYIAHTNIGTDTERKRSKGKRANHMIQF